MKSGTVIGFRLVHQHPLGVQKGFLAVPLMRLLGVTSAWNFKKKSQVKMLVKVTQLRRGHRGRERNTWNSYWMTYFLHSLDNGEMLEDIQNRNSFFITCVEDGIREREDEVFGRGLDNINTQKAALAKLPLTTHPHEWAEPHTFTLQTQFTPAWPSPLPCETPDFPDLPTLSPTPATGSRSPAEEWR